MFRCRLKRIGCCFVLAALVSLMCVFPMGAQVTGTEASSAELASDGSKDSRRPGLDRLAALQEAETYAYRTGLIPLKFKSFAYPDQTGTWHVLFDTDRFVDSGGRVSGFMGQVNLHVCISPTGCCYTEEWPFADAPGSTEKPAVPAALLNEASATLLARSYAVRRGMIPTDTTVEQVRTEDGGWLIGFTPGTYDATSGSRVPTRCPLVHAVVYVRPNGVCNLVPEDLWSQIRPRFP